jgi:hypothetical protein
MGAMEAMDGGLPVDDLNAAPPRAPPAAAKPANYGSFGPDDAHPTRPVDATDDEMADLRKI